MLIKIWKERSNKIIPFLYNINEKEWKMAVPRPHTSLTSLSHYQSPLSSPPPHFTLQRLLGSGSCDPPWTSSTLTNGDNILNWPGSPISGTQTQISGSSPVKRAPGIQIETSSALMRMTGLGLLPRSPPTSASQTPPHILFCISFSLSKSAFSVT